MSIYNRNPSGLRSKRLNGSVFWAWILTDGVTQIWVTEKVKASSSNGLLSCASACPCPGFQYHLFSKGTAKPNSPSSTSQVKRKIPDFYYSNTIVLKFSVRITWESLLNHKSRACNWQNYIPQNSYAEVLTQYLRTWLN